MSFNSDSNKMENFIVTPTNSGSVSSPQKPFYYTIVAPKKLRANTPFLLNVTAYDADQPLTDSISARFSIEDEENTFGHPMFCDVNMKLNTTETISIPIGNIPSNRIYKLVVRGAMDHMAYLDLQTQSHVMLIQTDKAIYKPGDCVKFRVLVLNDNLKAAAIDPKEINITITVVFFYFVYFNYFSFFELIFIAYLGSKAKFEQELEKNNYRKWSI